MQKVTVDPLWKASIAAIASLRGFITLLVVAHHTAIAYGVYQRFNSDHYLNGAPIVDSQRWIGFDVFVLFNDTYFMSLMFLVSGLFVTASLERRGSVEYLRERLRRLGLPFLLSIGLLMPVAYYPSFLATGAQISFLDFWWQTLTQGPWPGGPAWFLWLLYLFGVFAVLVRRFTPNALTWLAKLDSKSHQRALTFPLGLFVVSSAAYLPMLFVHGPSHWYSWGLFSVQASRVLLYACYFIVGVAIGPQTFRSGWLAHDGALSRTWLVWCFVALISFGGMVLANLMREALSWSDSVWNMAYGLLFVLTCTAQSTGILGLFLRFATRPGRWVTSFSKHAFAIYILHYVFVLWLQHMLLGYGLPAIIKGSLVFAGAIVGSWGLSIFRLLAIQAREKSRASASKPNKVNDRVF